MISNAETTLIVGNALCNPGHEGPVGPTAIRITNGRIAAIDAADANTLTPAQATLVALPAPTNAHDHGRGLRTLALGAPDDTLEAWLSTLAREPRSDPYLSAAVAFARMAEGGIAATNHCHGPQDRSRLFEEAEAVARAAKDVGIGVAFAVPFMNRNRGAYGNLDALLDLMQPDDRLAFVETLTKPSSIEHMLDEVERIATLDHTGFKVQYGPIGPQWVDDHAMNALARASAETGRRVHLHLFETKRQREWADSAYPGGLIAFLDEIGLLSPRLTVAHGVWLTPQECALLAARGVVVAVNLSSNLRLMSGVPPVQTFHEAGLNFGIGLDAMSFDDDEDILREMRLLWRLGRPHRLKPAALFDAAFANGRRTVLDDDGGKIAVGAPADILVLDLGELNGDCLAPAPEIADLVLTRATKRHIGRLIVGGRTIVERGRCVSVDLPKLEAELLDVASASRAKNPPNDQRILRLQQAVLAYYRQGCHERRSS